MNFRATVLSMSLLWTTFACPPLAWGAGKTDSTAVTVHQAGSHVMRYHVALPTGWRAGGSWPVVVVIPDAAREFVENL